jgi:hypothetical protein
MQTDSCTTRPTPAASAASATAAEPWSRTRWLSRIACVLMNLPIGGMPLARLTTASCPANAEASASRSNSDTRTGAAPWRSSAAALAGARASAVTA